MIFNECVPKLRIRFDKSPTHHKKARTSSLAMCGLRLTANIILSTLFNSLFFQFGKLGVGVAMTRDPATLMVGQYFKRKRELVEIFLVSGSGLGIATMSVFIKTAIR